MQIIIRLILSALTVFIAANILPGIKVSNFTTALIVAVVLGVINTFIKPVLVILTLPINVLTLGLFMLVINGFLVFLTSRIVPGFFVENFWWAIIFSLVITFISSFLNNLAE